MVLSDSSLFFSKSPQVRWAPCEPCIWWASWDVPPRHGHLLSSDIPFLAVYLSGGVCSNPDRGQSWIRCQQGWDARQEWSLDPAWSYSSPFSPLRGTERSITAYGLDLVWSSKESLVSYFICVQIAHGVTGRKEHSQHRKAAHPPAPASSDCSGTGTVNV